MGEGSNIKKYDLIGKYVKNEKLRSVLDPSSGGTDIGGMIDPGGKIIKGVTGSDFGRKMADPAKIIPEDPKYTIEEQKKLAKEEEMLANIQRQREEKKLSEAQDDIARRKAMQQRGLAGRSLLTTRKA